MALAKSVDFPTGDSYKDRDTFLWTDGGGDAQGSRLREGGR